MCLESELENQGEVSSTRGQVPCHSESKESKTPSSNSIHVSSDDDSDLELGFFDDWFEAGAFNVGENSGRSNANGNGEQQHSGLTTEDNSRAQGSEQNWEVTRSRDESREQARVEIRNLEQKTSAEELPTCQTSLELKDILISLSTREDKKPFRIYVRRNWLWEDYLLARQKPWVNPTGTLKVVFVDEAAVDDGGPKREFFTGKSVSIF